MKKYTITVVTFILSILLMTSCWRGHREAIRISDADRIEIAIIPDRSSEMPFKAKIIRDKNQIIEICNFANGNYPELFYKQFPNLPDGYLSFYSDSVNIQDVYFTFDIQKGYFQYLENGKQKLITEHGYEFLKRIYDGKEWLPPEIEDEE